MITIDFSARGNLGLCEFIYESVKSQILSGVLSPDTKLPSKRSLAVNLGVSIITVQNAYAQLISEGYIYSIEKKGFFVTDISLYTDKKKEEPLKPCESLPHSAGKEEKSVSYFADFTSNTTSAEKFPFTLWAHTLRQILSSGDQKLLQTSGVKGTLELRQAVSAYLRDFRNLDVTASQIVIGAGSEYLYTLLVQFLGRDKVYAVENPGFKRAKEIFELNGVSNCAALEIDDQGMNPELLRESGADVAHISPNHHFPTGTVMPVRRRLELLSWCGESKNHYLIEDDYDSEFRFNGKPLPTLQSLSAESQIIYMNTFSKTLSPSFRIGFMVLPHSLLESFETKMKSFSCPVSAFEQFTLARFMQEGFYEKHINRMRNYYRNIRNSLISEMHKSGLMSFCEIDEEEAGLHFLLKVNRAESGSELKESLEKQGIKASLLNDFFYYNTSLSEQICDDRRVFVINYSGIKKENIAETVRRMKLALKG